MRTPRFPRSRGLGINMTPMIDVVFLLIIFFLVSNHLVRQETLMQVELPEAFSGEAESAGARPRLTLTVLADGTCFVAGEPVTHSEVEARIATLVARGGPDVEVRVRGSRELPYRLVEPLMVACAKRGVWNLTFAVHEPESH